MKSTRKAVVLLSGGLDSMLAARVIQEQGVHVEGINFYTGFCHSGHTSAIRGHKGDKPLRNDALWVAEQLGIRLHFVDIVDAYKDIVINPQYGYGKNLNPCLDCKIFMVEQAHAWMLENGFDFIVTGEVVGQRPKSQRKQTLPMIAKRSGADDVLLRPLCAHLLPPTLPEREGWVNREALHGFHGRGRKGQFALAESFGIAEFAQPAGGCCVLTDGNYTQRLEDMWQHRGTRDYELEDIILLKAGRHLRPAPHFKLIIARDEPEGHFLNGFRDRFVHLELPEHRGPLALVDGELREGDAQTAAGLIARFSSGRNDPQVPVNLHRPGGPSETLTVTPIAADAIPGAWYV